MSEGTSSSESQRPKKPRKKVKRGPGRPAGGGGHEKGGLRNVLLENMKTNGLWTPETLAELGKTTKESARETLRRAVVAGWMKRNADGSYKLTRRKP
jgi:hypothetical protein